MLNNTFYIINPENKVYCIYAEDQFHAIQKAKIKDIFQYHESKYTVLKKRKKYTKKFAHEK